MKNETALVNELIDMYWRGFTDGRKNESKLKDRHQVIHLAKKRLSRRLAPDKRKAAKR